MTSQKRGFINGFVVATVLVGAVTAWSVGELYTPKSSGNWIRDSLVYAPGTADQINVLADIQPGKADTMFDAGMRLNTLAAAGKKQNWDVAGYQAEELQATLERLMVTRPAMTADLTDFLTVNMVPLNAAIAAKDKVMFAGALGTLVAACNTCHVTYGKDFLVVKPGKSTEPLQF